MRTMSGFRRHAQVFVLVNAFLVAIWLMTGAGYFWPVWVLMGWGLAVGIHGVSVGAFGSGGDDSPARPREVPSPPRALGSGSDLALPTMPGAADRVAPEPPSQAPAPEPPPSVPPPAPAPPDPPGPGGTRDSGTRFVTLLFSDLVGSTSLNETLGDAAWSSVLGEHRELVREVVARHDGHVVGTQGDGFMVRFDSPVEAVTAACEILRSSERHRDGGSYAPHVRIGLHAGDAVVHGDDLIGTVVNVAARVCSTADAQQILATEPVAERVAGRISMVDQGLVPLKGVTAPRHLFSVDWDDRHVFEHES